MRETESQLTTPVAKWSFPYWDWVVGERGPTGIPKQPSCCQDYMLLSTNWQQGPTVKDNTYTIHWTWRCRTHAYIEPVTPSICNSGRPASHHEAEGDLDWLSWLNLQVLVSRIMLPYLVLCGTSDQTQGFVHFSQALSLNWGTPPTPL